ncbi:MAG: hypothetical protein M3R69_01920 [Acidobacteriota bacterium]|nr:hypothetical protein [Acidobacteriota bacterium]
MNNDVLLQLLRYALPLITAAIALRAINKRTAEDNRKAKRTSRLASNALILTALLATWGIQFTDDRRQQKSAAEQLKRNNVLLEQVIRGQYPLQNIRASYQLQVPLTFSGIEEYERRLNGSMPQITSQVSSSKYRQSNDIRIATLEPPGLMFCQNSPFMPSMATNPGAARLFGALNVRVLLYRKPVKPEQWPLFVVTGAGPVQPDVEMWFAGGDRCIDYRARERVMILRDIGAETDEKQWESSGDIVSVMDLRGAQMVVDVDPRRTDQLDSQLPLDEFEFFVGSLEALWLPKDRFIQRSLANGDIAYEFVFPASLDEILALQRRFGKKAVAKLPG